MLLVESCTIVLPQLMPKEIAVLIIKKLVFPILCSNSFCYEIKGIDFVIEFLRKWPLTENFFGYTVY